MRFCSASVLALFLVSINGTTSTTSDQESPMGLEQQHNLRRSVSVMTHKAGLVRDRLLKDDNAENLDNSDDERIDLTKIFKFRKKPQIISTDELPGLWMNKKLEPGELFRTIFGAAGVAGVGQHGDMFLLPWIKYAGMYRSSLGHFPDDQLISVLQQLKSEQEIVAIFHQLRAVKGMEKFADSLQLKMFNHHPSSREAMLDTWIKTKATPDEVFRILGLDDKIYQWLQFASKSKAISEEDMLMKLPKSGYVYEAHYAGLLQVIKDTSGADPELMRLAERLQNIIFQRLLKQNERPLRFGEYVGVPVPNLEFWEHTEKLNVVLQRGWKDPYYKALQAYTVAYATKQGGKTLRNQVNQKHFNLQPYEAVIAAQGKAV
ncbi:unnamed protein product [Phytophthora fragariaefolia]|uniref:Unnamed protein product n=1 Tax=Phytophthora fragariaefolia TaxID=1490495 RepID=A0A9W7CUC6_9STRA|nr:unnamed protein product [Phytophthora fragariaefolia]